VFGAYCLLTVLCVDIMRRGDVFVLITINSNDRIAATVYYLGI
jgi:hypothetical protein